MVRLFSQLNGLNWQVFIFPKAGSSDGAEHETGPGVVVAWIVNEVKSKFPNNIAVSIAENGKVATLNEYWFLKVTYSTE